MNINIMDLLIGIVPALISYFVSINQANNKIKTIKEETERDLIRIKADTEREIEKIKADTEREIEKINAETESQIRLLEIEAKNKENEKMNNIMYDGMETLVSNIFSNPKAMEMLLNIDNEKDIDKDILLELIQKSNNI